MTNTKGMGEMSRWPSKPETWKPRETSCDIPNIGTVSCVAEFVKSEEEGTSYYNDKTHQRLPRLRTHWTVTATFNGQEITSPYSQGSAYDKPPNAESVVSSLALDAQAGTMEFEEFAGDFGYDSDSRSAYATWETCRNTELRMRRMFGDKFDALVEWGSEQ